MSGSNSGRRRSGGGGGGSGGGGGGGFDCSALIIDTTLNSVAPDVVQTLKASDKLAVELGLSAKGREILLANTASKQTAGSLTPPQVLDIMNCLKNGHSYIAEVLADPVGGECRVRIKSGKL